MKKALTVWIPSDRSKFTSRFRFVELMRYVPSEGTFVREKRNGRAFLVDRDDVEEYRRKNHNLGLYTSVFSSDSNDLDRSTRLGSLYFDLDAADVHEAQVDAIRLVDYLSEFVPEPAIRIYTSGNKGFHIECEAFAVGIPPQNDLPRLFRYIATALKQQLSLSTIDFANYEIRRMWRLPNSQHQKSGLYKVDIGRQLLGRPLEEIEEYAAEPHWDTEQPQEFSAKANEWFREWTYKIEEKPTTPTDFLERFNRLGSGVMKEFGDGEMVFDPIQLFDNCHSIRELWEKSEREHHLEHEERLFLCSILTYNKEAIDYLLAILQNCSDFNEAKSMAHINDWIKRREHGIGGRPFSCKRANESGVGCLDCKLEPKPKVIQVGNKYVETGEMSEPSPVRFAYSRKK